jgi:hypothetical protein
MGDLDDERHEAMCEAFGSRTWLQALPLGAVVCTAVLAEALPVERVPHDLFGDYSTGRWAWRLDDVHSVEPHVPAKGMRLWGWPWRAPEGVMRDDTTVIRARSGLNRTKMLNTGPTGI